VDLNDVIQRTLLLMSYDVKLKDVTIEKHLARSHRCWGIATRSSR